MSSTLQVLLNSQEAKLPQRQNEGDVGYDLVATGVEYDEDRGVYIYDTGVHIQVPDEHAGIIVPRSSVYKRGLMLANNVGVIDQGYRGEIKVLFVPIQRGFDGSPPRRENPTDGIGTRDRSRYGVGHTPYAIGDRIAQLLLMPVSTPEPVEISTLTDSERGEGGFGSTGDK